MSLLFVQIEERILGIEASAQIRHVKIQGNQELMEQELPVYEPTLKKYGFVVQVPEWYRGRSSNSKSKLPSRMHDLITGNISLNVQSICGLDGILGESSDDSLIHTT